MIIAWIIRTLDKTTNREEDRHLGQRTLQLFQLFLLVIAFYMPMKDSANPRLLVSLACLVTVFLVGKVEAGYAQRSKGEDRQGNQIAKKDETKTAAQALDWLLKSKNVQLLTDAIQYLLRDLGLIVSPCLDHPAVDRLFTIPGIQVTWGVKVLSDVGDLNEDWDQWEELGGFDLGKGGERRLLIVGNNHIQAEGDRQEQYRSFSPNTRRLLSARKVLAMTTLTLGKIYVLCKKKKGDIKTIFDPIQHQPGGVFQLERFAR
ncbi:MAG: hypothetical protein AMK69_28430 [Nitrospira bacterium SG8_3]|nr:MAG: hypothetical protein AMK69_28430 [Nitrospira bacterium SG8_3]